MATYYEFKKIVGRFFGCRITEENDDDDISVCLQGRYREATGENYSDKRLCRVAYFIFKLEKSKQTKFKKMKNSISKPCKPNLK